MRRRAQRSLDYPPRFALRGSFALGTALRAHNCPLIAASATSRFNPAIDAVGVRCFGQRSVHD